MKYFLLPIQPMKNTNNHQEHGKYKHTAFLASAAANINIKYYLLLLMSLFKIHISI